MKTRTVLPAALALGASLDDGVGLGLSAPERLRRRGALAAGAALALALGAPTARAAGYTFTPIAPPTAFFGLSPSGINDAGLIVGEWQDPQRVSHGFTFTGGVFTSFDAPAADGSTQGGVTGTQGLGLDSAGRIVGDYVAGGVSHGFVRNAAGQFTTLDVAGHVNTAAFGINDSGTVALQVDDGNPSRYSSVLRAADGTLTPISFPGTLATGVTALNNAGVTVGGYLDAADVLHGWIRNPVGVYTSLDDAAYSLVGPWSLNSAGWVVGELDFAGGSHGFVRDPLGQLSAFDAPGAVYTIATGIDTAGDIVGQACDAAGLCQGFLAIPAAVPEPGTLALWLAGAGVVGLRAGRRPRAT